MGSTVSVLQRRKGGDGWRVEMLNGVEKFEGGERS
jgi:hypothetical protein